MKILFRILVILVVGSLIGGAMFAFVNMNGTSGRPSFRQGGDGGGGQFPGNGLRLGGGDGGGGRRGKGNILGLVFGMIRNLLVVAVIAAVYFNFAKMFGNAKQTPAEIEV